MALFIRLDIKLGGLHRVRLHTEAAVVALPQQEQRPAVALLGGFFKPVYGLVVVLLDPDAPIVTVAQVAAAPGSGFSPRGCGS